MGLGWGRGGGDATPGWEGTSDGRQKGGGGSVHSPSALRRRTASWQCRAHQSGAGGLDSLVEAVRR